MKTTEEKNRIIAEFMGNNIIQFNIPFQYEIGEELPTSHNICTEENAEEEVRLEIEEGIINSSETFIERPNYHTSWDLIIPVVKEVKLSGISSNDNGYEIIDRIDSSLMECDIDSLHSHLYDFIEWYNENK